MRPLFSWRWFFMDDLYYEGTFQGRPVRFKRFFSGRLFTEDECDELCQGAVLFCEGLVNFHGNPYSAHVHLSEHTFTKKISGRSITRIGINVKSFVKEDLKCAFGHVLTADEIVRLEDGQRVYLENCMNKQGKRFNCEVSYGEKPDGSIGLRCHFDQV